MAFDFRLPNITGATEREQLAQIKSYLFSLVEQLQWAVNNIDTAPANGLSSVASGSEKGASSSSPQVPFSEIKSLIIKSADIVNAYCEKIEKKLEGVYVARSDFGTFKEQTLQGIEATSTEVKQAFTNIQAVISNVETIDESLQTAVENVSLVEGDLENTKADISGSVQGLTDELREIDTDLQVAKSGIGESLKAIEADIESVNYAVVEVTANVKTGLLYYSGDGTPVYGLEIGQKTIVDGVEVFNKYARFTSDRLSFYDQNGTEVAYISDKKLYIANVEVLVSLKEGGFIDIIQPNGDVVTKWVGIGGE